MRILTQDRQRRCCAAPPPPEPLRLGPALRARPCCPGPLPATMITRQVCVARCSWRGGSGGWRERGEREKRERERDDSICPTTCTRPYTRLCDQDAFLKMLWCPPPLSRSVWAPPCARAPAVPGRGLQTLSLFRGCNRPPLSLQSPPSWQSFQKLPGFRCSEGSNARVYSCV